MLLSHERCMLTFQGIISSEILVSIWLSIWTTLFQTQKMDNFVSLFCILWKWYWLNGNRLYLHTRWVHSQKDLYLYIFMIQVLFQRTVSSYQFNLSMKAQCVSKFLLLHLLGPVGSHRKYRVSLYVNFKQLKMKILSRVTHCCSDQNRKWIKQLAGLLRPQERKATY